jgi:hypothetical protein
MYSLRMRWQRGIFSIWRNRIRLLLTCLGLLLQALALRQL